VSLWSLWIHGLSILWQDRVLGSAFLIPCLAFGLPGVGARLARSDKLSAGRQILLGLGEGMVLLSLTFFIILAAAFGLRVSLSPTILLLVSTVLAVLNLLVRKRDLGYLLRKDAWQVPLVLLVYLLLAALRLAFIQGLLVPPYADSASHFQIIQDFLELVHAPASLAGLPAVLGRYYHYGFHALAAWITLATGSDISRVMLVLGQYILALIPLTLFVLVRGQTDSTRAAVFASALSLFGWAMPGYAINWGKYPAVAGIALVPLALYLDQLALKTRKTNTLLWGLFFTIGATIFHSRSLVLIMLALASYQLARILGQASKRIFYITLAGLLLLAGLFCTTAPPLWKDYVSPMLAVLLLFPFALRKQRDVALGMLLWLISILAASFFPLPAFFRDYTNVLLDGPFVELSLFLPLSVLGGLGMAGLAELWKGRAAASLLLSTLFLAALVLEADLTPTNFLPNPVTTYVTQDDLYALEWMKASLPPDSFVVISAIPIETSTLGADAGIWTTPLTGFPIRELPYDTPWSSNLLPPLLCSWSPDVFVYFGDTQDSFIDRPGAEGPYQLVFSLDRIQIEQVSGCRSDSQASGRGG
jgi:hypothetical protein